MTHPLARLVILLVFLAAVANNGLFLGLQHDEGVTVDIALGSFDRELLVAFEPVPITALYSNIDGTEGRSVAGVLDQTSRRVNPQPPGYFLLLRIWTQVFGTSRVTMRVLSLVFALLTLMGMMRLARRLVPRPDAAAWIMLLAVLSPWFVILATFARPYSMALCVGVWSTVAALAIADDESRDQARVAFISLSVMGLYTLYHYGFVVVWHGLFLAAVAWRTGPGRRRRELGVLLVMGALIATGFGPWFPRLLDHLELSGSMASYYRGPIGADAGSSFARLLTEFFLGDKLAPGLVRNTLQLAVCLLLLATVILLVQAARHPNVVPRDARARTFLLSMPWYPVSILAADLLHGTRTLTITKTSLLLFPILLLLVVHAWLAVPTARARWMGLSAWGLVQLTAMAGSIHLEARFVDHHRAVARSIVASDGPHHTVILNSMIRGHAIPLLLTLKESGVENVRIVYAPPLQLASVLGRTSADPETTRVTLLNLHAVYAHDDSKVWTKPQLKTVARHARADGWDVRYLTPARLAERPQVVIPDRRFEIIDPVW